MQMNNAVVFFFLFGLTFAAYFDLPLPSFQFKVNVYSSSSL